MLGPNHPLSEDHEPTVRIALAQTLYPLAQTLLSLGGDGLMGLLDSFSEKNQIIAVSFLAVIFLLVEMLGVTHEF